MEMGWFESFDCDLTDDQRQLCEWVARQARTGARRIYYEDAQDILGIRTEERLTCLLRSMRERLDGIHDMIASPIVNTTVPYFDIREDADHIWDNYCQAEEETLYKEHKTFRAQEALVHC